MVIDCKQFAENQLKDLKSFLCDTGLIPCLAIVSTEEADEASKVYMRNKIKAANKVRIITRQIILPRDSSQKDMLNLIDDLNNDNTVSGIIVQLPLPKQYSIGQIQNAIIPVKDVDGFSQHSYFTPCTPTAVINLLKFNELKVSGTHCVVIGRSDIVGKPLAHMLLTRNATITQCHSFTSPELLSSICKTADYIFSAAGKVNLIKPEYLIPNKTILIDISINRDSNGKLCGDADKDCYPLLKAYTPVPGGIGPLTVAQLMYNTVQAESLQRY